DKEEMTDSKTVTARRRAEKADVSSSRAFSFLSCPSCRRQCCRVAGGKKTGTMKLLKKSKMRRRSCRMKANDL
ncbi:hypothetical protein CLOSTHATH_03191, partial [Hungatella hathewayi DSM 13479]